jgi:hypothetical protein
MLMTAREYEQKKIDQVEKPREHNEQTKKPEKEIRYFLQHPDGNMSCEFQIEIEGAFETVKLENGRAVIKKQTLADALLKRGYIEYRRMEVLNE